MIGPTPALTNCGDWAELLEVQEKVMQLMQHSPIASLRNVTCEIHGDGLVLRGHVESFYVKQMAQEAIRRVDHRCAIFNMLSVE